ncbi:MAG: NAD(P)H-dependent flavin oxidoreductase [Solirubrobacteraceae bacterium]
MILDQLEAPVILAPLGGGPSTPELAAAVSEAGGLGFLASAYLSASTLGERIRATRSLTDRPIGVNIFVPGSGPTEPSAYRDFLGRLATWGESSGARLGEARYSDDDWEAKVELMLAERLPVVSFTFGCPDRVVIEALQGAGSEVWVTITSPEEAAHAGGAGADVLVVQGSEAGGHRASFTDRSDLPLYGLLALLSLVLEQSALPLVASGGIATGRGIAAVLCAGARAAQLGSAFMLCPEAGTSQVHRAALRTTTGTALTRAFTGRLARGIHNEFLDQHSAAAPIAYPELHYVTAPMRAQAREAQNADLVNLWAGETHALAREAPAAEVVRQLVTDAEAASQDLARRLPGA